MLPSGFDSVNRTRSRRRLSHTPAGRTAPRRRLAPLLRAGERDPARPDRSALCRAPRGHRRAGGSARQGHRLHVPREPGPGECRGGPFELQHPLPPDHLVREVELTFPAQQRPPARALDPVRNRPVPPPGWLSMTHTSSLDSQRLPVAQGSSRDPKPGPPSKPGMTCSPASNWALGVSASEQARAEKVDGRADLYAAGGVARRRGRLRP